MFEVVQEILTKIKKVHNKILATKIKEEIEYSCG